MERDHINLFGCELVGGDRHKSSLDVDVEGCGDDGCTGVDNVGGGGDGAMGGSGEVEAGDERGRMGEGNVYIDPWAPPQVPNCPTRQNLSFHFQLTFP